MKDTKYTFIDMFAGAGGLDIGVEAVGFETVVAVELDESCCDTLRTKVYYFVSTPSNIAH